MAAIKAPGSAAYCWLVFGRLSSPSLSFLFCKMGKNHTSLSGGSLKRLQSLRYASRARTGWRAVRGRGKGLASGSKCWGSEPGSVTSWLLRPGVCT